MQHVDDAVLIAYADDALDAEERRTVDEHLAGCATCRARVEQERALAQRADEVLAAVAPAAQPVPPFEDVLRRRDAPPSRPRGSWVPLAWAASLIVALGAGWMANELLLSPALQAPAERAAQSDPSAPDATVAADAFDATSQTPNVASQATAETAAPPSTAAPRPESAPSPAPESSAEAGSSPADAAGRTLALEEIVVRGEATQEGAAAPAEARRADARSELAAVAFARTDPLVAMELNASDVIWRGTSVADAPLAGEPVRGVADVAIDSVWVASDSADWRARVLQRLEDGALEVIEWRRAPWQGVVASGTLADGRRYLLGRTDSVLVELRARLDVEELEALLARVRPLQ